MLLVFYFAKKYLPIISVKIANKTKLFKSWLYLTEAFIVVIGLLIFISFSVENNLALAIVLMLILISILYFFSLFYLKDYLAGLLFKSSKEYQIGDQITVNNKTGRIEYFTKTQLKIKSSGGDNILIPYSILLSETKSVRQAQEKINTYNFELNISIKKDLESEILNLQRHIRLLPWIHPNFDAGIEQISEDTNSYTIKVTIYAFDKKYYPKIEKSVRDSLKK